MTKGCNFMHNYLAINPTDHTRTYVQVNMNVISLQLMGPKTIRRLTININKESMENNE